MSTDQLLTTVLGLYRDVHDDATTEQILGTTSTLLTTLSNPLNVTLLTKHFLSAPAIWDSYRHRVAPGSPNEAYALEQGLLNTCMKVLSVFSTAARRVRQFEIEGGHNGSTPPTGLANAQRLGGGLDTTRWAHAVMAGRDLDRSAHWQHLLVLTGMAIGLDGAAGPAQGLLQRRIVYAANDALKEAGGAVVFTMEKSAVVLALSYVTPVLAPLQRQSLDADTLLQATLRATFRHEGTLRDGIFLGLVGTDVELVPVGHGGHGSNRPLLSWPANSPSFLALQQLTAEPLVSSMGSLANLAALAVENAISPAVLVHTLDELLNFTARLLQNWSTNPLCEVEGSEPEEAARLAPQTLHHTFPVLAKLLQKIMYTVLKIQQAILARVLTHSGLSNGAPRLASKSLAILRNLYFISSRSGNDSFQVYKFAYMVSIDVLSRDPAATASLLQEFLSVSAAAKDGVVSPRALERTLDLFYLNLVEHLPLSLTPDQCEALIVTPAVVYLTHLRTSPLPPTPKMVALFESAHCALLSVFSCPHNLAVTTRHISFYAETLFMSFPARISSRQFRHAFKTVLQVVSPPFPISAVHPTLGEELTEMLHMAFESAGAVALPLSVEEAAIAAAAGPSSSSSGPVLSQQAALVLAMVDAFPYHPLPLLEAHMARAAAALCRIEDGRMRYAAVRRFWEVLGSGEMDVERAPVALAWWGTRGGRERVLYGIERLPAPLSPPQLHGQQHQQDQDGGAFLMSGALPGGGGEENASGGPSKL